MVMGELASDSPTLGGIGACRGWRRRVAAGDQLGAKGAGAMPRAVGGSGVTGMEGESDRGVKADECQQMGECVSASDRAKRRGIARN